MVNIFPWIVPALKKRSSSDKDYNYEQIKKNRPLYDAYCELIKKYFLNDGLKEWKKNVNDDPWSPGNHFIVREEKRKILNVIPTSKSFGVIEIMSEPKFAEGHVDINMPCEGLKIRIIESNYRYNVKEFVQEYEHIFKEKVRIV